jgi:hypothetical protein
VLVESQFRDVVRDYNRGAADLVEWVQGLPRGRIRAAQGRNGVTVDTADTHATAHT